MADQKATILIQAKDEATKVFKGVGDSIKSFGGNVIGATLALAAVTKALKFAIGEAIAQEKATRLLNQAMIDTGTFSQEAANKQEDLATALQKTTTYSDDQITSMQSLLVRLGKLSGEGLTEATKATLDMASALGLDLDTAGKMFAKTLANTATSIGRFDLGITGASNSAARLADMVAKMNAKFGGAAAAEVSSFSGKMENAKNRIGEASEKIGFAFIPVLEDLIPVINRASDAVDRLFGGSLAMSKKTMGELQASLRDIATQQANIDKFKGNPFFDSKLAQQAIDEQKQKIDALVTMQINAQRKVDAAKAGSRGEPESEEEKKKREKKAANDKQFLKDENERRKKEKEAKQKFEDEAKREAVESVADIEMAKLKVQQDANERVVDEQKKQGELISDLTSAIAKDGAAAAGLILQSYLTKQIEAWMTAEITKALSAAPLSFGASLAAIAPIAAQGAAGIAAVNSIKFHSGGQVTTQNSLPLPGGDKSERVVVTQLGETWNGDGGGKRGRGGSPVIINMQMDRRQIGRVVTDWQSLNKRGLG